MPNVYIIMGKNSTDKSSIIRALTGVDRGREWPVATNQNGNIDIFVQIKSLQEETPPIQPQQFIDEHQNYSNILLPLWVTGKGGYRDGRVYIQEFIDAGWQILQIVILLAENGQAPELEGLQLPEPLIINLQNPREPVNAVASRIRGRWGWL